MAEEKKAGGQEALGTEDLKRVLGKADLYSIAVGQIIGAGVFALTGIVIGKTGRSVNLAFMIAAFITILTAIPAIFVGGTIRMRGGTYTQAATFLGKKFAGFYMFIYIFSNLSIAMYAISFAQYVISLFPSTAPYAKLMAFIVLTAFWLLNMYGIQGSAFIQNAMVVLMMAALALFVVTGMTKIQPGYFSQPGWITNGTMGLLTGIALLQYATGGASVVVNFGAEAKNPTKDIPMVIIVSTLSVALLYGLIATIAAGVLPIEQVANKPLTLVAKQIMPSAFMYFFILCGAGFALTTTLNATLGWVTKPLLQATIDGWFPKSLGYIHPKYKTPMVWLSIMYVLGCGTIFFGINIGTLANFSLLLSNITNLLMAYSITRMPKVIPNIWAKSGVHTSNAGLWAGALAAMSGALFQIIVLGLNQSKQQLIGNVVILVVGMSYAIWREKTVQMQISYEDN